VRRWLGATPKIDDFDSKLVGGEGFEPSASLSRNLGGLVHGDGLNGIEFISEPQ
jgi:hypothetical protein